MQAKAHDPNASGAVFKIDFARLVEINAKTGFEWLNSHCMHGS